MARAQSFFSYFIVIGILIIYQLMFYGALGPSLGSLSSYLEAFPALLHKLFPGNSYLPVVLEKILHLGLAASAFGGSYGIMFSNGWNLYMLAQHGHLFFGNLFTHLNRHAIPIACIILEGIIYMSYLIISAGNQVPLQQLGALGSVIGYSLSVLALLVACYTKKHTDIPIWIPFLGFFNCLLLVASCINGMLHTGPTSFFAFMSLLIIGSIMFFVNNNTQK